jgi:fatty acid/phospholipid biosynthesis enzyme
VQTSKPEITFVGRLKGRDIFRGTSVDGWLIIHISMGFEGNITYAREGLETDGIKMSKVYLHSGAKDLLQSSFFLHQYTASSISGEVFETVLKRTLWNAAEIFCHGCLNFLNVRY